MIIIYVLFKNNIPFYIGYTKNIKKRISMHRRKYGNDVEIDDIDFCDEINKKEIESFWISIFKSWGFKLENKNEGGGGPSSCSEEVKEKIRNKALGRKGCIGVKHSPLSGIRKSLALTGKPKPKGFGDMMRQVRLGVPKPKSMGDKVSKALKGKSKPKCYKPVLQYDLEGNFIREWLSINHAAEGTNSNPSTISKVCRGIFKKTNGFIFKFK